MKIFDGIKNAISGMKSGPSKQELAKSNTVTDTRDVFEAAQEGINTYYSARENESVAWAMTPSVKYVRDNSSDPRVSLLADTALDVSTRYDDVAAFAMGIALKSAMQGVHEPASTLLAKAALQTMEPSYTLSKELRDTTISLDPEHKFKSLFPAMGAAMSGQLMLSELDDRSKEVGKTFLKAIRDNSDNPEEVAIAESALSAREGNGGFPDTFRNTLVSLLPNPWMYGDDGNVPDAYWAALNAIAGVEENAAMSSAASAVGGIQGIALNPGPSMLPQSQGGGEISVDKPEHEKPASEENTSGSGMMHSDQHEEVVVQASATDEARQKMMGLMNELKRK